MNTPLIRFTQALTHTLQIVASAFLFCGHAEAADAVPCGLCYGVQESGDRVLVPLESTIVTVDVKPGLLEAEIDQTFTNRTTAALEAVYLYPLPDRATVTHFELRYKDRVIRSSVKERGEAKATYEQAKDEGKKTALIEQTDPSLFSTSVANFLPGETVHVVMRLIQPLEITLQGAEVRFPMVTSDKYFSSSEAIGVPGNASQTPPRPPGNAVAPGHVYGFDVQVAGFPAKTITSPSHSIRVETLGMDRFGVSLEAEITVPDRDFVLRIENRRDVVLSPLVSTQRTMTGDYGLLTLFPPAEARKRASAPLPRDVLFLLDHSGSMSGERIQSARLGLEHCLAMLHPQDRFQVVIFNDQNAFLEKDWTTATPSNLADAREAIRKIEATGGTEMQKALGACLEKFDQDTREHLLVFLTDGDVGEETSLLNMIDVKLGRTRLFSFGIGSAPNASLLRKMAERGHGQVRYIANDKDVDPVLVEFFATIDAPVLSEVTVTLLDAQFAPLNAAVFPERLGDVFLGRPLRALYRCAEGTPAYLDVSGTEEGRPVNYRVTLQTEPMRGSGLEKQFGHEWYETLLAEGLRNLPEERRVELREQRLKVALLYELVTDSTSRVAVDERVSRASNEKLTSVTVAQANFSGLGVGEDVIELSPFVVDALDTGGYTASSTLAGSRVRTTLKDASNAVTVVTREFLSDMAPVRIEDALHYIAEPLANPSANSRAGTFNRFPFTRIVDPATVADLTVGSIGPSLTSFTQRGANAMQTAEIRLKAGTAGTRVANVTAQGALGGPKGLPVLGIFSWGTGSQGESGAYLTAKKQFGEQRVSGHVQTRQLDDFGRSTSFDVSYRNEVSHSLSLGVDLGWSRVNRSDPFQFHRTGTTRHRDNLGLFGVDTLTGAVSRLEEVFARLEAINETRLTFLTLDSYVAVCRHEQNADERSNALTPVTTERTTDKVEAGVSATWKPFPARMQLDVTNAVPSFRRLEGDKASARTVCIGVVLGGEAPLRGYANVEKSAQLPWVATGLARWQSNRWVPLAPALEQREGARLGAKVNLWDNRLVLDVSTFQESVDHLTYRDWRWELQHPGDGYTNAGNGLGRAAVSYDTAGRFRREGTEFQLDCKPLRSLTLTANGYVDWKNEGPVTGGNRRASFAGVYDFKEGMLKHLSIGLGASFENDQYYNDGYILPGGLRVNLMLSYHLNLGTRLRTTVRLNLQNAGDVEAQPTRYSIPRGRECLLTLSQEF